MKVIVGNGKGVGRRVGGEKRRESGGASIFNF